MKKHRQLDNIRVETPCTADWNEMVGNDEVRFCSHCAKSVNDISAITRKQARKLVDRSRGNICVRYIADPRTNAPLYANDLVQISRRSPGIAAGVIAASLSLASFGHAQSAPPEEPPVVLERLTESACPDEKPGGKTPDGGATATVTGTVTDSNGAVIPNAAVVALDGDGKEIRSTTSNDEGIFSLDGLAAGTVTVTIASPGFKTHRFENVSLAAGASQRLDATLDLGRLYAVAGGMAVAPRQFKTDVIRAVDRGNVEEVREILSRGADVNEREDDKTSALHLAVESANVEMVRLLIDFGAKVNARDEDKRTALMKLDSEATRELAELLVRSGAKVNATADDGDTPLINAAGRAPVEVVQFLIDEGAELNARDEDGETALMKAAYYDDAEAVRALLVAGADANLKNDNDVTALDQSSTKQVIDVLRSFGAQGTPQQADEEDQEEPAVDDGPTEDPPAR